MILKKILKNNINIFVTSDLHFDHENIIKYCNRPFKNKHEMNHVLIENWNRTVKANNIVYFLGDMTYGPKRHSIDYWLSKLNGNIRFIRGNHDTDKITRVDVLANNHYIKYKGYKFLLMHDPYRSSRYNGWIIHGDKHNNDPIKYPHINKKNKTINVCTELTNYTPVSLDSIIEKIS